MPYVTGVTELRHTDVVSWNEHHERIVYADATPQCIGIVRPGYAPLSVRLEMTLPIYIAEYVAALVAVLIMANGEPFTVYSDNIGVCYNLHKGRCPRSWLPLMLALFERRDFSVRYIASSCNPADAPSRADCTAGIG